MLLLLLYVFRIRSLCRIRLELKRCCIYNPRVLRTDYRLSCPVTIEGEDEGEDGHVTRGGFARGRCRHRRYATRANGAPARVWPLPYHNRSRGGERQQGTFYARRLIFSLPFCDWCQLRLRVYSRSTSAIGACHGYWLHSPGQESVSVRTYLTSSDPPSLRRGTGGAPAPGLPRQAVRAGTQSAPPLRH
eukprot:6314669-Pyramimonas_sp.AAC.1